MAVTQPEVHQIASTIRFLQGYRFLDRCGEAIIRLEDALDSGWIPGEISPKGGALVNHELGMTAQFHSESMTVAQAEFLDLRLFRDQACKMYDVLRQTFEIATIKAPSLRVVWQQGFAEISEAETYLASLGLVLVSGKVASALDGSQSALSFTVCTEDDVLWKDESVLQRRRLDVRTVMQVKQPTFDDRLLRRARLLPDRQRDAMQALAKLRQQHRAQSTIAAQFDLENSFESEFRTELFDLPAFYSESWNWQERAVHQLSKTQRAAS